MSQPEIMSCNACRDRKLKCDRNKPSCGKCLRTGRECTYPERKTAAIGSRRNYAKALEARLGENQPFSHAHTLPNLAIIGAIESKLASRVAFQAGATFIIDNHAKNDNLRNNRNDAFPEANGSYKLHEYSRLISSQDAVVQTNPEHVVHRKDHFRSRDLVGLGFQELLPPEEIQQEL